MKSLDFVFLSKKDHGLWNRFVDKSPQGSIFAKTYYLEALGYPYKIGALIKGESISCGIVLTKNEIATYSNPIFAKYLGVLTKSIGGKYINRLSVEKNLIEQLISNIKKIQSFDYTFHPKFNNWLPFSWNGYRQETRYTYQLRNLSNITDVYRNFHSKIRNDIKKAKNNGICITDEINLEHFFAVNRLSFERQGGNIPYNFQFFKQFYTKLSQRDAIKLMGARDRDGRLHAVCGIVFDKKCCHFIINGIDHTLSNLCGNALLVMKSIEFASKRSETFDFEGSMIKNVEKFYRYFGGTLTPYFNIWRDNLFNNCKRMCIKKYKKLLYGK